MKRRSRSHRAPAWIASCLLHAGLVLYLARASAQDHGFALLGGMGEPRPSAADSDFSGDSLVLALASVPAPAIVPSSLERQPPPVAEAVVLARLDPSEPPDDDELLELLAPPEAAEADGAVAEAPRVLLASALARGTAALAPIGRRGGAPAGDAAPPGAIEAGGSGGGVAAIAVPHRDGFGDALAGDGGQGGSESHAGIATGAAVDGSHCKAPAYPPKAMRFGIEGVVLVDLDLRPDGSVAAAAIAQSSGYPILDEAALSALETWVCVPARDDDGRPIASKLRVPVRFRIDRT